MQVLDFSRDTLYSMQTTSVSIFQSFLSDLVNKLSEYL
jgi:hypothetical protein